jgi:hypothetical protein
MGRASKAGAKVQADVDKIGAYLARDACATGYVIVFEECDWGFEPEFAHSAESTNRCKVRFIRGY